MGRLTKRFLEYELKKNIFHAQFIPNSFYIFFEIASYKFKISTFSQISLL